MTNFVWKGDFVRFSHNLYIFQVGGERHLSASSLLLGYDKYLMRFTILSDKSAHMHDNIHSFYLKFSLQRNEENGKTFPQSPINPLNPAVAFFVLRHGERKESTRMSDKTEESRFGRLFY